MNRTQIRTLHTQKEIEEIRPTWKAWPGHRDSDIDFFCEVVKSNPNTLRPNVIVAYCDEKPDAILVGRLDSTTLLLRFGYWQIASPRIRVLIFVMGAQRGNPSAQSSELLLREAFGSLERREVEALRFDFVPVDSDFYNLSRTLPASVVRDRGTVPTPHWSMELSGSYDRVLANLSGDFRNQLKRKAKKIRAVFPDAVIRCLESSQDVDIILRDVERVACKSYQRGLGVGFCDNQETRSAVSSQIARGNYLAYILYLKGDPAAFWLGASIDSVFYSDYLAFDSDFGAYSPGSYLQMKVVESLINRGSSRIDFGPGDARYKSQLGTCCRHESSIYVFPKTPKGVALNLLRTLTASADRTAKRTVEALGMLTLLKRSARLAARKRSNGQSGGE